MFSFSLSSPVPLRRERKNAIRFERLLAHAVLVWTYP